MTNSNASLTSTIHFKLFILIWLTLQSTVHTLLIKYSRNHGTYDALYYPTVAVFFMEILKCLFSLLVTYIQSMGFHDFLSKLHVNIWINWREAMCIFVPTILYTLQNNLVYISLHHLNAASFVIIYQLKILFAALFSILLLGRKISLTQWLSIFVIFVGVIIITWTQNSAKINVAEHHVPIIGILAVLFASTISGLAGVMVEKVLKDASKISLWLRNIQMSIISIPSSFVTIFLINKNEIIKNGMLHGFDSIVWLTVIWYSIGGISVAICLKYVDNIAKDFAIAISIIFTAIGSIFIFNFNPDILFFVGLILVIGSTFFYSKSHKIIVDFVKKHWNNYTTLNYQQIEEQ